MSQPQPVTADPQLPPGPARKSLTILWLGVLIGLPFAVPVFNATRRNPAVGVEVFVATLAISVITIGAVGFVRSPAPSGWLLHLTSAEAAAEITANQQPGHIRLATAGGRASVHLMIPGPNPWERRLCFFSRAPSRRARRFNHLKLSRCAIAIWVRADDLCAINSRFYRRRLDGAVAWPGSVYQGPARVEPADLETLATRFGPRGGRESPEPPV